MIDIGVARPSAHGHAMISTATALTSACASRGSGPATAQTTAVATATTSTAGTNHAATRSASRWIGARLRCASATIAHDLREQRVARRRARRASRTRRCVHVPPVTGVAGGLLDRHRLAGDHRFVDAAGAFEDDAVDRHALAGPHAQAIADVDQLERDVLFAAVARDPARGLRREAEQRADRAATVALRARSSSTWPSSTSAEITAAASK